MLRCIFYLISDDGKEGAFKQNGKLHEAASVEGLARFHIEFRFNLKFHKTLRTIWPKCNVTRKCTAIGRQ